MKNPSQVNWADCRYWMLQPLSILGYELFGWLQSQQKGYKRVTLVDVMKERERRVSGSSVRRNRGKEIKKWVVKQTENGIRGRGRARRVRDVNTRKRQGKKNKGISPNEEYQGEIQKEELHRKSPKWKIRRENLKGRIPMEEPQRKNRKERIQKEESQRRNPKGRSQRKYPKGRTLVGWISKEEFLRKNSNGRISAEESQYKNPNRRINKEEHPRNIIMEDHQKKKCQRSLKRAERCTLGRQESRLEEAHEA